MKRLDKVYQDLEASGLLGDQDQDVLQNHRLLTDVIAFGNKVNPMLKQPTPRYDQASEAIDEIELDTTGVEKVMEAVTLAANKYKWMHLSRESDPRLCDWSTGPLRSTANGC